MRLKPFYFIVLLCLYNELVQATPLHFEGRVVPAPIAPIIAPFDGTIRELPFAADAPVPLGALLVHFDSPALESALTEAKADLYALEALLSQKKHWESSSEMQLAKQQMHQATQAKSLACDRAQYSNALLAEGIVSKQEALLDNQQCQNQTLHENWAKQQLKEAADKKALPPGTLEQIAQLKARIVELETKVSQLSIYAIASGYVWPKDSDEPLWLGMKVQEGQVLGSLVADNAFLIQFQADEWDVVRLHPGDKATISFYALPGVQTSGMVDHIDAYPQADAKMTTYRVTIRVQGLEAPWRFGMRTQVSVEVPDA